MPIPWGFNVPHFTFNNCNINMYNGSVTQQSKYALTQEQLNNFADLWFSFLLPFFQTCMHFITDLLNLE